MQNSAAHNQNQSSAAVNRRDMLTRCGMGFGGLALGSHAEIRNGAGRSCPQHKSSVAEGGPFPGKGQTRYTSVYERRAFACGHF